MEIEDLHSKHLQKKRGEQIAQWSLKHFVTGRISNVQQQTGNEDQLSLQVTCTALSEASEVNFTSSFYIYDHFIQKDVLHLQQREIVQLSLQFYHKNIFFSVFTLLTEIKYSRDF